MLSKDQLIPVTIKSISNGDLFGRLTVVNVYRNNRHRYYAECKCECGSEKLIRTDALIKGSTVSCGCYHSEIIKTHGFSRTSHYQRWLNMINRCDNPNNRAYHNYGGRGITVCHEWYDFETYLNDLPDGYVEGAQLDRVDNNKGYYKDNVRWVSAHENAQNTRVNRNITHNGVTKCLSEWARDINLNVSSLSERIERWGVEKALTTEKYATVHKAKPKALKGRCKNKYVLDGIEYNINELSELSGVSSKLLRKRINERGWSVERAVRSPANAS